MPDPKLGTAFTRNIAWGKFLLKGVVKNSGDLGGEKLRRGAMVLIARVKQ